MVSDDVKMGRFVEAASSEHHTAAHGLAMDAIGLHPGTKQYILDHRLADVAGHLYTHPELVRDQDEGEQLDTVKGIRAKLDGGGSADEDDDNAKTGKYLGARNTRSSDAYQSLRVQKREQGRRY
jgi:hypothetical protein